MFKILGIIVASTLLISTPYSASASASTPQPTPSPITQPEETPEQPISKETPEQPEIIETLTLTFETKDTGFLLNVNTNSSITHFSSEEPLTLIDADTSEIIKTCLTIDECNIVVDFDTHKKVFVQTGSIQSNIIDLISPQNIPQPAPRIVNNNYSTELSITNEVFPVEGNALLDASSNIDLFGTGYALYIIDLTDNIGIKCLNSLSCANNIFKFKTGGSHSYQSFIADEINLNEYSFEDLTNIQASSNILEASRMPWHIGFILQSSNHANYTGSDGYIIINQPNVIQTVSDSFTPYKNVIWNYTTNQWLASEEMFFESQPFGQYFVGYIGIPIYDTIDTSKVIGVEDVQATTTKLVGHTNFYGESTKQSASERVGGKNPSEECVQACGADPVNTFTGEFWETTTDLDNISSVSPPLNFSKTYSSFKNEIDGPLGYGWTHNYNLSLLEYDTINNLPLSNVNSNSKVIQIKQENGSYSYFMRTPDGTYISFDRTKATLSYDSIENTFVFTRDKSAIFVFDLNGNLIQQKDRHGNALQFTYNFATNELLNITDTFNQKITLTWVSGKITKVKNSANKEVLYTYNNGNLKTTTNVMGGIKEYTYSPDHKIIEFTGINGGSVKNTYNSGTIEQQKTIHHQEDENGNTTTIINALSTSNKTAIIQYPDGSTNYEKYNAGKIVELTQTAIGANYKNWVYEYDSFGNITKTTNPDGTTVVNTYNVAGKLLTTVNEKNQTFTYVLNSENQIISTINPSGIQITFEYNSFGDVTSMTDGLGNTTTSIIDSYGRKTSSTNPQLASTVFTYDNKGFLATQTNALNQTTSYINNNSGLPTQITDSAGNISYLTYNNFGQIISSIDAENNISSFIYDENGFLLSKTNALNQTTSFEYDNKGNILKTTDANNTSSSVEYNNRDKPVKYIDAKTNITKLSYDGLGNVLNTTNPLNQKTQYVYNWRNQVTRTQLPSGKRYDNTYDLGGLLKSKKDPMGSITTYAYDASNRTTSITDPLNNVSTFEYNANNNVTKVIKPDLTTQINTYDNNGRKIAYTDENGNTANYSYNLINQLIETSEYGITYLVDYDNLGNPVKKTNASDNSYIEYEYDKNSLLKKILPSDSSPIISYDYNALGLRTKMVDNNGETNYTYDNLNRANTVSNVNDGNIVYNWDKNSNLISIKTPSNKTTNYTYDEANNMKSLNVSGLGTISYEYNIDNLLDSTTLPNGVKTVNEYNDNNLLTEMKTTKANNTLLNFNYDYTQNNIISSEKTTNNVGESLNNYSYDSLSRMSNVTKPNSTGNYTFDNVNNLLSTPNGAQLTYESNTDQITMLVNTIENKQIDYTYDARGNRNSQIETVNSNVINTTSNYNVANQLIESNISPNPPNNTKNIIYGYNGEGLRNKKTVTQNTTTTNEFFIWNSVSETPTLLEDKNYTYIYGLGSAPIAQIKKSNNTNLFLHADNLGSIRGISDNTGNLVEETTYNEYGEITTHSGSFNLSAFKFAGEYFDSDIEMYNLRARWYDPESGQFTTVDPLLNTTHSSYGYTQGNPLNFTDPLGLDWLSNWTSANMGWLQDTSDWFAGFGDIVTTIPFTDIHLTELVRNAIDPSVAGVVNKCSDFYIWGGYGGAAASLGIGAKGLANIISSGPKIINNVRKGFNDLRESWVHNFNERGSVNFNTIIAGTNTGSQIRNNYSAGKAAERAIMADNPGSAPSSHATPFGMRHVDAAIGQKLSVESKVGLTRLTPFVKAQIKKDTYLAQTFYEETRWEFTRSKITNKIGPDANLMKALTDAGFSIAYRL